jgi:hypothetical protein
MTVRVDVSAVPCSAREIPKSITRGPSAAMRMLPGLRSRWTRPRTWIACSASIRPPASRQTAASGSGPDLATSSASDGPGHVGRGEPWRVVVGAGADDGGGVGAADGLRRFRLAPEPPRELGIARQFRVDDLHRDRPRPAGTAAGKPPPAADRPLSEAPSRSPHYLAPAPACRMAIAQPHPSDRRARPGSWPIMTINSDNLRDRHHCAAPKATTGTGAREIPGPPGMGPRPPPR